MWLSTSARTVPPSLWETTFAIQAPSASKSVDRRPSYGRRGHVSADRGRGVLQRCRRHDARPLLRPDLTGPDVFVPELARSAAVTTPRTPSTGTIFISLSRPVRRSSPSARSSTSPRRMWAAIAMPHLDPGYVAARTHSGSTPSMWCFRPACSGPLDCSPLLRRPGRFPISPID